MSPEERERMFERADAASKPLLNATFNTDRLLQELRLIRWLLVALLVVAVSAIQHWWPDWWRTPWWPQ